MTDTCTLTNLELIFLVEVLVNQGPLTYAEIQKLKSYASEAVKRLPIFLTFSETN